MVLVSGGKVKCVTCLSDQVVCASDNGSIQVLRFDSSWSKPTLFRQYQTEAENEGPLVDMVAYFDGKWSTRSLDRSYGSLGFRKHQHDRRRQSSR